MKIGFDSKRAFYNNTGLGNYSRNLILDLARFYPGNNYHVYTPTVNQANNFLAEKQSNISIHTPLGFINKAFPSLWRSGGITKDLQRDGIQIYHGLSNELPMGIEKTKIKTVVTIHDVIFKRHPKLYPVVDRKIYERKWKHALSIADKIIAVSEQTKRDIIEFFEADEKRIEVVYQAAGSRFLMKPDESNLANCLKKQGINESFILAVGRVEERKNLKVVVEALALMKPAERPLFVIAGKKTDYFQQLDILIKKNNLQSSIQFLQQISDEDLNCFYHSALGVVYPSLLEGFGLPVVEAQSAGTPVICSNDALMHETSGGAASFANPNVPEEWKERIKELQIDKELRQKLRQNGLENIKRFASEVVTKQMVDIYLKLA